MTTKFSFPGRMKAVFPDIMTGHLIVKETDTPKPGKGEVLVRMAAAPVNPSDLARIRGFMATGKPDGFIPGLEGSGTVVASGGGLLAKFWLGKRVACSSASPASGTWAQYMVTPAAKCFSLAKGISFEQGSMSLVNPLTALGFFGIVRKHKHKAVISNAAASALGRMVELLGKRYRVPVINIVRRPDQADKLRREGSRYVLDSSEKDFTSKLKQLADEVKATILFEPVCGDQLQEMIDALPDSSSVIIYGNLTRTDSIRINPGSIIGRDIRISGFYLGRQTNKNGFFKNIINLLKVSLLMKSQLKITVSATYPLAGVREAVDAYLSNMSAGKVILLPGERPETEVEERSDEIPQGGNGRPEIDM